jgi:hypothetical protein
VFGSVDDFIHSQLGEHLPPHLQWLPACCDPEKLRTGYERGLVKLWTIGLSDGQRDRLRVAAGAGGGALFDTDGLTSALAARRSPLAAP